MSPVENFLTKLPDDKQRETLQRIREIIHEVAPGSEEVLTYGMAGFKFRGKYLLSFGSFKDHLSVFPGSATIATLGDSLQGFHLSKGTIQFSPQQPLSDDLVRQIVQTRVDEILAK